MLNQISIGGTNTCVFFFSWREYPHDTILRAWKKTKSYKRATIVQQKPMKTQIYHSCSLLHTVEPIQISRNFFSKHWSYLGRSSATRELGNQDFMITYRKPPSLKDMLVRAKIAQPTTTLIKGCNRLNTCKYCGTISQSGKVKNLNNNKSYNTITNDTCQSKNPIYCLECNWCQIKYISPTKNRI